MNNAFVVKVIGAIACGVVWKYGGATGQAIVIGVFAYLLIP